ncbi:MAG: hypothetical protein JW963_05680 [Anaerolineales bacterium]|nr:hypothetical protein [Anaerolineales bacterium]
MTRSLRLSLFLLSAAALTFEITLTRVFSVAQFYHFAFMIVSIALLGFGASGTALTIFPKLGRNDPRRALGLLGLATGVSLLGAYLLTNLLPFDSFSIAWDRRQVGILVLHYLALATPFFFSGMAVGLLLDASPKSAGEIYAANLFGSALGCIFAMIAPPFLGAEGAVTLSSGLAALGALVGLKSGSRHGRGFEASAVLLLVLICLDLGLRFAGNPGLPFMELHLSPYKGYSYVAQYPQAELIYRRWNAFSRVDVARSGSIHSIPGLSYRYLEPLPGQDGIFVDGDDLSALLPEEADMSFSSYLPTALPFELRPGACALVLEPRGGLDILASLALGAEHVKAVEGNPLVVAAAKHIYAQPDVGLILETGRTYLRRERTQTYDVIILSLTNSYHPVRSGAYSLGEDYRYTVEAFQDAIARLTPNGLLTVTRWLQNPPSEGLRAFALAVTALERNGGHPESQIVAFRGYNTITVLVKNGDYTLDELGTVRAFASERAFDLVYAPDLHPEETNRYNILPEPIYYQTFNELLNTKPRQAFYKAYPFDVRPPTDDHPFFGHYFKWSQAEQVLAELGRTWQPFGGAGYFVILALLALATGLAGLIILLPLAIRRPVKETEGRQQTSIVRPLLYFGLIGLAFLLVEIPLLQRFILYLGNPAYALTAVLFSILLFSAIGSRWSHRVSHRIALLMLVFLVLIAPFGLPHIFSLTLGLPLVYRFLLTALILAPIGFLMGIPFPAGIQWLQTLHTNEQDMTEHAQVPWMWATNGAASVVASVLAALLALTFGFNWVLGLGAACYASALLTVLIRPKGTPARSLPR